jgi:hypothetical protein
MDREVEKIDFDTLLYIVGFLAGVPLVNYLALYLFRDYVIGTSLTNLISKVLIPTSVLLFIIGLVLAGNSRSFIPPSGNLL